MTEKKETQLPLHIEDLSQLYLDEMDDITSNLVNRFSVLGSSSSNTIDSSNQKNIALRADPLLIDRLDALSPALQVSRNQLINDLVAIGLNNLNWHLESMAKREFQKNQNTDYLELLNSLKGGDS